VTSPAGNPAGEAYSSADLFAKKPVLVGYTAVEQCNRLSVIGYNSSSRVILTMSFVFAFIFIRYGHACLNALLI